jgi:hypothetical protein
MRINVQNHSYVVGTGNATGMYASFASSPNASGATDAFSLSLTLYNIAAMHVNYLSLGGGRASYSINQTTNQKNTSLPFFNNTTFNTMSIGSRSGSGTGDYFQGTMSLMMISNRAISPSEYLNVYALIKTTIGKGLGLP